MLSATGVQLECCVQFCFPQFKKCWKIRGGSVEGCKDDESIRELDIQRATEEIGFAQPTEEMPLLISFPNSMM